MVHDTLPYSDCTTTVSLVKISLAKPWSLLFGKLCFSKYFMKCTIALVLIIAYASNAPLTFDTHDKVLRDLDQYLGFSVRSSTSVHNALMV